VGHDKLAFTAMQPKDIPAVMALEEGDLSAWNRKHLEDELKQPASFQFVAKDVISDKILAVLFCRIAADEGEILKLAVDRSVRQKGIGVQLLNYSLSFCREQGVKRCYLELRVSNSQARQLYEKCSFSAVSSRKKYYNSPVEDAILMQRQL
jgi:ribosomal-protein-alanine N-acetyltransferase